MIKKLIEWDDEIEKKWKNPVYDGITNLSAYKKSKYKILWILKESNKSKPDETFYLRGFHKDVTDYKLWRKTYNKLIYVTYGLLHDVIKYKDLPWIDEDATTNNSYIFNNIAVININKGGGKSQSIQVLLIINITNIQYFC